MELMDCAGTQDQKHTGQIYRPKIILEQHNRQPKRKKKNDSQEETMKYLLGLFLVALK
jgi:hypothetical protein